MRALRIVSVCRSLPTPADPSGGIFVFNRLAAMRARADVTIIQPVPYTPFIKPLPTWAAVGGRLLEGVEIHHAPMFYLPGILKSKDSMWLARAIGPAVEQLHRSEPIDLIDAHFGYPEGAGCVAIGRRLGIPVFITIRGFENEYLGRPFIGRQLLLALRAASGCISVSHSLRDVVIRHGVAAERVRVVHNAIDAMTFCYSEQSAAREALGVPASRPLVVSVGHLVSRKRHHVLLDAFAQVRRSVPDAELMIIGATAFERLYPGQLLDRARKLGIDDATHFPGNLPPSEVARWLRAADVFALATAREGCCNALLEALASGVPVVTTPVGDNAHFVDEGRNGYLVPVDDASALAEALGRALGRRDWNRAEISKRLLEQAGTWDDVARRVLDFMSERLGRDTLHGHRCGRQSFSQNVID
jgi:teichuronic acid biosynthesis glycosyltransferase TuaC